MWVAMFGCPEYDSHDDCIVVKTYDSDTGAEEEQMLYEVLHHAPLVSDEQELQGRGVG